MTNFIKILIEKLENPEVSEDKKRKCDLFCNEPINSR
jgi:hypothetical protein